MAQKFWTAEDLKAYGFAEVEPEVYSITDAEERHSVSVDSRFRVYAFRMFLRIVCIVLALFTDGWLMWLCIVGAVVLPAVAVVVANGEDRQHSRGDFSQYLTAEQNLQLEAARVSRQKRQDGAPSDSPTDSEDASVQEPPVDFAGDVIDGEIVDSGE